MNIIFMRRITTIGESFMSFIKKSNAQIFLFLNAFLWGSSYVWSKMLLGYLPRFSILFICSLGGLISTIVLFYRAIKFVTIKDVIPSIIVSVFSIISNTFFMLALQYTSSSNTAFIVQTSVVITPVIMALIEKKMLKRKVVISAIIALAGLFFLTCDFSSFRLNTGDLLALGNALFFSLFLTGLNVISKKVDPVHFTFVHHTTNTIVFFVIAVFFEMKFINFTELGTSAFALLAAASICVSVITVLVQSTAIKFVRPEKATLIYTMEPVVALLMAFVFVGEKLNGLNSIVGFVLIFSSVLYSIYKPKTRKKRLCTESSAKPVLE